MRASKRGKRSFARERMIDKRRGVGRPQRYTRAFRVEKGGFPRRVNIRIPKPFNFGNEGANVTARWVKLLALGDRVENAKIRGSICARTRNPLPACRVAGGIGVH